MCVVRGLIHWLKHDGGLQSIASCPLDTVCNSAGFGKIQVQSQLRIIIIIEINIIFWQKISASPVQCTLLGVPSCVRFCQQEFGELLRLVGCYCSYLLPKQGGGTSQILVDKTSRMSA